MNVLGNEFLCQFLIIFFLFLKRFWRMNISANINNIPYIFYLMRNFEKTETIISLCFDCGGT